MFASHMCILYGSTIPNLFEPHLHKGIKVCRVLSFPSVALNLLLGHVCNWFRFFCDCAKRCLATPNQDAGFCIPGVIPFFSIKLFSRRPPRCQRQKNKMAQAWGRLTNRRFLTESKEYVTRVITEGLEAHENKHPNLFCLSPTTLLTNQKEQPIPASDLKVDSSCEQNVERGSHFKKFTVDEVEKDWLKDALERLFKYYTTVVVGKQLFTHIGTCMGEIMSNVALLLGPRDVVTNTSSQCTITSESELRFAIADPIMKMICTCWGYQVTKATSI